MFRKQALALSITVGLFCAAQVRCDDWPQWRGPNREGVWREDGIVARFDVPQLAVRWRTEIASGYSGPTVADGRVYLTDRVTSPASVERVHCFDAMAGSEIWSHSYRCEYEKVGYGDGPRASVAINEGRAYSLGTMGHLFCFDAAKGEALWSKDLRAEYKIRMPFWGIAASPLVEHDLVIVQIGGEDNACVVAFNTFSGKQKWRALNDRAGHAAPLLIDQAGEGGLFC